MSQSSQVYEEFRYAENLTGQNVRLLYFEHGSGNDELRCSLKPVSLDNPPDEFKYNALSYVWGDQSRKITILCNTQKLQIGENLYSALWQLREEGLTCHPLWVDAICINQHNIPEKTEQLRIMKNVYQSADLVIGWLGPEKENDEVGFALLRKTHELLGHYSQDMSTILDLKQTGRYDHHEQLGLPDHTDPQWKAVCTVLERPYFNRVWIIQEILVARRCVIKSGKLSIDREAILGFGGLMDRIDHIRIAITSNMLQNDELDSPDLSMEAMQSAIATKHVPLIHDKQSRKLAFPAKSLWLLNMGMVESEGRGMSISSLLGATSQFEATECKDKIFALVGLSSNVPPSFIDYGKTVKQLQIEIAKISMHDPETWGPLLFSLAQSMDRPPGVPSWVPCWIDSVSYPSLISYYFYGRRFNGEVTWWITSENTVRLRGVIFDKVDTIIHSEPYMASTPHLRNAATAIRHGREMLEWIDSIIDLCKTLESYPTGGEVFEAAWRTLVFNREREGIDVPPDLLDSFRSWMDAVGLVVALADEAMSHTEKQGTVAVSSDQSLWGRINQYLDSWREVLRNAWFAAKMAAMEKRLVQAGQQGQRFDTALNKFCFGRKFFKSQNGYLGWVPATAQQGDVIVLFEDCSLPFVLRHETDDDDDDDDDDDYEENGDSGQRYRVVGDAYIHGYMHSRAESPYDVFEII